MMCLHFYNLEELEKPKSKSIFSFTHQMIIRIFVCNLKGFCSCKNRINGHKTLKIRTDVEQDR